MSWDAIRRERLNSDGHKKRMAYMKGYRKERYRTLKEYGLCVRCGVRPAKAHRVMCKECLLERNQTYGAALEKEDKLVVSAPKLHKWKMRYEQRKEEKRCVSCGLSLDCNDSILCTQCRKKRSDYLRHRRKKRKQSLLNTLFLFASLYEREHLLQ